MQCRSGRLWTALAPVLAAMIVAGCAKEETTGPRIASLAIVSGTGQAGPIGASLPLPLVVRVEDQAGQPVAGVLVTWQVTSGGGLVTPSQSTSDENGEAIATFRLGTIQGLNTVTARIDASTSVTFSATATAAPPTKLLIAGGNAQVGVVATQLIQDIAVLVTDAVDNPKAGVLVSFAVTSGGGSLSSSSAVTDATGSASVRWTLGTLAGPQAAIASVSGIAAPVNFTATAQAGAADALTVLTGNNQSGSPGSPLPDSLRVRLTDKFGNPISGVTIFWAPAIGSGTVNPSSSTTDVNGRAATRWTLGSTGGPKSVVASGGGFTQTFTGGGNVLYSSVSAGGRSTCGITTDAVMLCWGYNGEGQLGIGQPPQGSGPVFAFPQPTATTGDLTFRQIVASLYHACAVTLSSIGYCWGVNLDGRLGTGSATPSNEPIQVVTPVSFRMMAVSRNHTCGLSLSDRVWCWGYAQEGQTGTGAPPVSGFRSAPVEVAGDPTLRFQAVVAGGQHSCALTTTAMGSVAYCWGFNASGQLGDGSTTSRLIPTMVGGGLTFKDVDTPVAGQLVPQTIAAGYDHTCALSSAGVAYCWGRNANGQLGTGGGSVSSPAPVSGGLVFTSITAGEAHSCGLTAAGAVFCWGSNANGQLGDGTTTSRPAPVLVGGGLTFASVSAGDQHTCGVTTGNLTYCWGDNQFGQLGDGTLIRHTAPTRVAFQP